MAEADMTSINSLERTPTWAVSTVCFVLILISILTEYFLHLLVRWFFSKKRRKSLTPALHNIKSELLVLGFISLLLTVSESTVAGICIPKSLSQSYLPCETMNSDKLGEETDCVSQGKVSLLSREGVRQIQYLIFGLALFHISSSVLTFSLGMAKMKRWNSWEAETRTLEYQFSNDPRRFQIAHQTSFGKRHLKFWSDHHILRWPACFLRQFYESVSKTDYLTLRHGFITAHFAEGSKFDFQKYLRRALDNDLSVVVGIRWWIWIFSIFFIFFTAHGFRNYLWLPFLPLVMLLVVGTKLQGIITKMCLDSHEKSHVVRGTLLVRPSDHYFWFGRPKLLLHFLHFILFQNSFQLAFFSWTWIKFGLRSCYHQTIEDIVIRLVVGVIVQFLSGYVTLPLYALVTQMGSLMNKAVFTEVVVEGLMKWRAKAKKSIARTRKGLNGNGNGYSQSPRPSVDTSSVDNDIDLSPSFRMNEPLVSRSVDSGNVEVSDSVAKGKRPVEVEDYQQEKLMSSFDRFNLATKIHHTPISASLVIK